MFHQFTVRFAGTAARDRAAEALRAGGVDARQLYPYTIGELPGVEPAATPSAARLRDTVLSLPVHPGLDDAQWSWLRETIATVTP